MTHSSLPHFSAPGFTLVEMLVSLGILSIVAAIGFGSGIDSYENALARSDRATLFWSILRARAEAMNGICEGSSCMIGVSQSAAMDASHAVVFEPLSGIVANPQSVVLGSGASTNTLSVNSEGQVSVTP